MGFGDWIDTIFGSPLLNTALQVGTNIVGRSMSDRANQNAANTLAAAQNKATQAVIAGNTQAANQFNALQANAQPGTDYLRSVVSRDPNVLTPAQQIALDKANRDAAASLAAGGLSGAGRAVTESINNVQNNVRAQDVASNLALSQSAANTLSSQANAAGTNAATIPALTGQQISQAALNTGQNVAQNTIDTGKLDASSMGALASIFANDMKDRARAKRYPDEATRVQ